MSLLNINNIDDVIALAPGEGPSYEALKFMAEKIKEHKDELAALSAGSTPGFAASIDTRWFVTLTGTNDYTGTPAGSPTSSESIADGMSWWVKPPSENTSSVTIDYGTADGAVPVKKRAADGTLVDLGPGDMPTNKYSYIQYHAGEGCMILDAGTSRGTKVLSLVTSGTYTMTEADVSNATEVIQPVDISSNNVTIKWPLAAKWKNVKIRVVVISGGNVLSVQENDATEQWSGRATGDYHAAVSDGTNIRALDARFTFESGGQTITAGTAITVAHNAPRQPRVSEVTLVLECTAAEHGYSIGDRIYRAEALFSPAVNPDGALIVGLDGTNVQIVYGSDADVFRAANKSTGAAADLTNASWQLHVQVEMRL